MPTCPPCPIGDDRCRGLIHARDCDHVADGVPGYAEMLRGLADLPPIDPAEAARLRRAAKRRVPLGCKACHTPPGPPGSPPA